MSDHNLSSTEPADARAAERPFPWAIIVPATGLCLYLPYAWIPPLVDNFASTPWGEYLWILAQFPGIMPNVHLTQGVLAGPRQDAWLVNFLMIAVLWGLFSWLAHQRRRMLPIAAGMVFLFSAFGAWRLYQALLA